MSCQSVLDYQMSEKGGGLMSITIHAQSGDLVIPANVNVNLFDCQVGRIDATKGNNAVFITRSTTSGTIDQHDGTFIGEFSQFNGEVFWRKSTRTHVRSSTFMKKVNTESNSNADIYRCKFDGSDEFGFRALDKGRATLSNCTVMPKRAIGVWALTGSVIDMVTTEVLSPIGLRSEDNSAIRMIGGANKATDIGAILKKRSQVYLSRLSSPFIASQFHVQAEEYSRLHSEGTDFSPTANIGIKAVDQCTIEVVNFKDLKSTGGNTIDVSKNCDVFLISGKTLQSTGAKAVYATLDSRVRAVNVEVIEGQGHAVHVDTRSKFVHTLGKKITSTSGNAVKASVKSTASVKNCAEVTSKSAEACVLMGDSRGWFATVGLVQSDAADAVQLTDEADVSFQNCGTILSKARHGVVASKNCTVQFQSLKKCIGNGGHGVVLSENSNLDAIYFDLIEGKVGFGVIGVDNCDVKLNRSANVKGVLGGVQNAKGGSFYSELVKEIEATTGTALTITGGESTIKKTVLKGQANAIGSQNSTMNFENATITGSVSSENDTYDMERTSVTNNGAFTAKDSTINMEIGDVNMVTMTNCTLDLERVNGKILTLIASSGMTKHGSFESIVLDVASNVIAMKTTGPITGLGNAVSMGGGVATPGMNRIEMQPGYTNIGGIIVSTTTT